MPPDDQLQQMLIDGQTKIFDELGDIKKTLAGVAVQKNEIEHINKTIGEMKAVDEDQERRLGDIETTCLKRHGMVVPLWIRVRDSVIIAVSVGTVLLILSVLGFTAFINLPKYLDFQRTQINATTSVPVVKK
jgi:hypothetical protein